MMMIIRSTYTKNLMIITYTLKKYGDGKQLSYKRKEISEKNARNYSDCVFDILSFVSP